MRRKCPRCNGRGIFETYFRMREFCPTCGMKFDRTEGDWTGAVAINLVFTELVFILVLVGVAVITWPDVPWTGLMIACVALNVMIPVLFYPYSRTIWVAIELAFHPLEPIEELEADLRLS